VPRVTGVLLRVRESFWFLPALFGVSAIVLAEALVALDRSLPPGVTDDLPFLGALSASGGRSLLSIIGSSMLTVAGTTFSITISVLATTSSTYGPRLVRNFMADRSNQAVLAVFTSTFLYAVVVMRTVHTQVDDSEAFVPVVAVHVAVLLAVLDVGVLVFFIHHIAASVQVTTLQARVVDDLRGAVAAAYRDGPGDGVTTVPVARSTGGDGAPEVRAGSDGYVQAVDVDRLRRLAAGAGTRIDVVAMPGHHVIEGDVLARVVDASGPSGDGAGAGDGPDPDRVRAAFTLGDARTPHQDVGFALQQSVEIAVRSLASGSNDPYTGVSALDTSAGVLVPAWRSARPVTALVDDDGRPRVTLDWPRVEDLVDATFVVVRTYATEHPTVLDAALRLTRRLDDAAPADRAGLLDAHVAALTEARGRLVAPRG